MTIFLSGMFIGIGILIAMYAVYHAGHSVGYYAGWEEACDEEKTDNDNSTGI
jgi:hypothetical protein